MKSYKIKWPDSKKFAFTIFDDTDNGTIENIGLVYDFLASNGFRTTKSVWPLNENDGTMTGGATCQDPAYLAWLKELQTSGFEIAFHNACAETSIRDKTIEGLQLFRDAFGHWPVSMANHMNCQENIYWGDNRLTGIRKLIYNLLTRGSGKNVFSGHVENSELFWGDHSKEYIKYIRSFVYQDINTLKSCPFMPYHDPLKQYVNYWFASSEGSEVGDFNLTISEENQDRLEQEGGCCIMYSHLASGFYRDGELDSRFKELMIRLSQKGGWFAPVSTLMDYLIKQGNGQDISNSNRKQLEWKWLLHKIFKGAN
jgi:hypothetical protein